MPRVLIAGVSTRAAAASAARAGFAVTTIDAFSDRDQHPAVRALSLPRDYGVPFSAQAAARATQDVECDAAVYLSNFENHPEAIAALAAGRTLWGNAPETVRHVRDPVVLAATLRARGFAVPGVRVTPSAGSEAPVESGLAAAPANAAVELSPRWLVKPRASGGGAGIRQWRPRRRVPRGCYIQELVEGMPGSVVFVAAGGHAVPIGLSRQLTGDPAFGASGYRYCGNIFSSVGDAGFDRDNVLAPAACALAHALAGAFSLVGVNGLDFVARRSVPYPVEVNPRWCASLELVERAYGLAVFRAHADACVLGSLPDFDLDDARRRPGAVGKAVVFARRDVAIGETAAWLEDDDIHDVPPAGEQIAAGRPVCTVFASGRDADACYAGLVGRARRVYETIER